MVMLNDLDRFHLVMDVIDRVPRLRPRAARRARQQMDRRPTEHRAYTREHGEDLPEIRDWLDLPARGTRSDPLRAEP